MKVNPIKYNTIINFQSSKGCDDAKKRIIRREYICGAEDVYIDNAEVRSSVITNYQPYYFDTSKRAGGAIMINNSLITNDVINSTGRISVVDSVVSDSVINKFKDIYLENSIVGDSVKTEKNMVNILNCSIGGSVSTVQNEINVDESVLNGPVQNMDSDIAIYRSEIRDDIKNVKGDIMIESSVLKEKHGKLPEITNMRGKTLIGKLFVDNEKAKVFKVKQGMIILDEIVFKNPVTVWIEEGGIVKQAGKFVNAIVRHLR